MLFSLFHKLVQLSQMLPARPIAMCLTTQPSQNSTFATQSQRLKDLPASPMTQAQEVTIIITTSTLVWPPVITALPHYVSRIDGYSPSDLRTYLNDNLGALISSQVDYDPFIHFQFPFSGWSENDTCWPVQYARRPTTCNSCSRPGSFYNSNCWGGWLGVRD